MAQSESSLEGRIQILRRKISQDQKAVDIARSVEEEAYREKKSLEEKLRRLNEDLAGVKEKRNEAAENLSDSLHLLKKLESELADLRRR